MCLASVLIAKKIDKVDPLAKPKGLVFLGVQLVTSVDDLTKEIVGKEKAVNMGPYIGGLAVYLLVSNLSGLLGFYQPTMNFSVTLSLAIITWVMVQYTSIKSIKFSGYIKSFFEPYFFLFVPNLFGKLAPLISLSMRIFGNILSGSIIMALLYSGLQLASASLIHLIAGSNAFTFNFLAPIIAPALHAYFDVFAGFIQMFIFIVLTLVYITNEIPEEEKK